MARVNHRELVKECVAAGNRMPRVFNEAYKSGTFKLHDLSIRKIFAECYGYEALNELQGSKSLTTIMEAPASMYSGGAPDPQSPPGGSFDNIVGQIIYNAILDAYEWPAFVGGGLVQTITTQFDGERLPGISNLGDVAELVAENAEYPFYGNSEDYVDTPKTLKRGFIVPLTREAIFFDRTGILIRQAGQVGESLGTNREKRILDAIIGAGDSNARHAYNWQGVLYSTYGDGTGVAPAAQWDNELKSNPLVDYNSVDAANLKLATMLDPETLEPTNFIPTAVLVTPQNLTRAKAIFSASDVRIDGNNSAGTESTVTVVGAANVTPSLRIVSSALLGARLTADGARDQGEWFLGDFAKAFAYMQNWPIEVTQAPATSGDAFHRDIVAQWKVSERGAMATIQPRAVVKNDPNA